MSKDNGGPAFPNLSRWDNERMEYSHEGMTLRDYFAAKALQGMYAADTPDWCVPDDEAFNRAKSAYLVADAMLKARKQ